MFDVADKKSRVFTRNIKTGEIGLTISETWEPKVIDEPMFIEYGDDYKVSDLVKVKVTSNVIEYYKLVFSYIDNHFENAKLILKNSIQDDPDDPEAIIAYNGLEDDYYHQILNANDYIDAIHNDFGDAGVEGLEVIFYSKSDDSWYDINFYSTMVYIVSQDVNAGTDLVVSIMKQLLESNSHLKISDLKKKD